MEKVSQQEFIVRVAGLCLQGRWYEAAQRMWPKYIVPNDNTTRLFNALSNHERLFVMGHGSASKSFTTMAYFLLKYWLKPRQTSVTITSATLTSLRSRAWADIKLMVANAAIPLGLQILDSRTLIRAPPLCGPDGTEITDDKHTIECVAADHKDSQSKVQGRHTENTCLIIEEADNKGNGSVWIAESNLATSGKFQLVALANPTDRSSNFGQACEPENGWDSADPETWKEWDTKSGHVVRLDGFDCPNYQAKKTIFPFLLNWEWFKRTLDDKGENSLEWWAYGRGWFPPTGVSNAIWPLEVINATLGRAIEFYASAEPLAALDPAFEGGDKCVLVLGRLGRQAHAPHKPALLAEEWLYLKRRDLNVPVTHDYASQLIEILGSRGIAPESFIMDATGNAIGLRDVLKVQWEAQLKRQVSFKAICFAGSPSGEKILAEDSRVALERFDRLVTEMCTASMEWARAGCLGVVGPIPPDLRLQLEARLGGLSKRKNTYGELLRRAETKIEMKKRGYHSPDESDALNLLVHLARLLNPANLTRNLSSTTYTDARSIKSSLRARGQTALPSNVAEEVMAAVLRRHGARRESSIATKSPGYESTWSDEDATQ